MLSLFLVLFGMAVVLGLALWLASMFLQGYLYTEPSGGLMWQAPAAAVAMTMFFLLWSLLNVWGAIKLTNGRVEVPYGIPWEFSHRVYVIADPVPRIESKKVRSGEVTVYELDKTTPNKNNVYKRVGGTEQWSPDGVEYVKFKHDGKEYMFVRDKSGDTGHVVFVDAASGLEMRDFEVGQAGYSSFGRVVVYFLLTVFHFGLWLVCFWLVLRFQFSHALALAFVTWLVFTLTVLPGLCSRAGEVIG